MVPRALVTLKGGETGGNWHERAFEKLYFEHREIIAVFS